VTKSGETLIKVFLPTNSEAQITEETVGRPYIKKRKDLAGPIRRPGWEGKVIRYSENTSGGIDGVWSKRNGAQGENGPGRQRGVESKLGKVTNQSAKGIITT